MERVSGLATPPQEDSIEPSEDVDTRLTQKVARVDVTRTVHSKVDTRRTCLPRQTCMAI
jgi:hypothetical protein